MWLPPPASGAVAAQCKRIHQPWREALFIADHCSVQPRTYYSWCPPCRSHITECAKPPHFTPRTFRPLCAVWPVGNISFVRDVFLSQQLGLLEGDNTVFYVTWDLGDALEMGLYSLMKEWIGRWCGNVSILMMSVS